jgi:hypothetical protein
LLTPQRRRPDFRRPRVEPAGARGGDRLGRLRSQLPVPHAVQHPLHGHDDVRGRRGESRPVGFIYLVRIDTRATQHSVGVGELNGQPGHRVGGQLGHEVPAAGLPTLELWVVMGAVQGPGRALSRPEKVYSPYRAGEGDRDAGIYRPLRLATVDHAQFQSYSALRGLLTFVRCRVDEEHVADHNAHRLESKSCKHRAPSLLPCRG